MKKILFLALGCAFYAISCSSKENTFSFADEDSTMIKTHNITPSTRVNKARIRVDSTVNMNSIKTGAPTVYPTK